MIETDEYVPPGRPDGLTPGDFWCRCGSIWRGLRICHCAKCHRTFTGLEGFEQHLATVCADCTIDKPCPSGHHRDRWAVECRAGVATAAEIVADADGRCRAPGGDPKRLAKASRPRMSWDRC